MLYRALLADHLETSRIDRKCNCNVFDTDVIQVLKREIIMFIKVFTFSKNQVRRAYNILSRLLKTYGKI